MVPLGGLLSTGLRKACHFLGLGDCLGMGEGGATRAGCSSVGEIFSSKENEWDVEACPSRTWQETTNMPLSSTWLAYRVAWQAEEVTLGVAFLLDGFLLQVLHDIAVLPLG